MNQNKYVFAQLAAFLNNDKFDRIVRKYNGNKSVRSFSCWNQLLVMLFGQLAARESLRDTVTSLQAHSKKYYHLGLGHSVHLPTLAVANEKRSYHIFEEFAAHMITRARSIRADEPFDLELTSNVYAFDSSTISLCLSMFPWAQFKYGKAAVKLHTLYDVKTQVPTLIVMTPARVNDINGMDFIDYQAGSYYIFDRGYNDYGRLYDIHAKGAFFVFRAREQLKFRRIYSVESARSKAIKADQIGVFTTGKSPKRYPAKIRRIRYYDIEQKREFIFLTNNIDLDADTIAELYHKRWGIELFFKWIKQHLRVKSFWGTSENAVRVQVYTAIVAYCLVAVVAKELNSEKSIYEILQVLSISLLDKTPVKELLTNQNHKNTTIPDCNLLLFN